MGFASLNPSYDLRGFAILQLTAKV